MSGEALVRGHLQGGGRLSEHQFYLPDLVAMDTLLTWQRSAVWKISLDG